MLRLIYNLFGWHYCHSFTKWERRVERYKRPVTVRDSNAFLNGDTYINFTRQFQVRSCTECGRIQQKEIY